MIQTIEKVRSFWGRNVCGAHFVKEPYLTDEFFAKYRECRYAKEHHLNSLIDWSTAAGESVLEIGLGLGADSCRWAEYADSFTGIDLTDEAVQATSVHLRMRELGGRILKGNAEDLPFGDSEFGIVYSHGVLHHTENIKAALREVRRVLKPDGIFIVMLYTKNSLNYWIRIQCIMRFRLFVSLFCQYLGRKVSEPWATHLKNIRQIGWQYFSWSNWPHRCTDGPECEIANIYSWREMSQLLEEAGFCIVKCEKAHLPIGLTPAAEQSIARWIGFYQFAWCRCSVA